LSLSFQIPWLVFVLAAVLGFALSFILYRYTVPPVAPVKRYLLAVLRGTALTFIIFAVCEPLLRLTHASTAKPVIAVLVDNSLSMSLTDDTGNREEILRSILGSPALRGESPNAEFELFTFSSSLHKIGKDSLRLTGTTTDIASAFHSLKSSSLPGLQAVLLLSDGNYNSGENPLYEAEKFGAPIFTVGIGDSLDQKDIVIQRLSTNSIAYVQSKVPLDATVRVSGFENQKLAVRLLEDGKQIDQQFIDLPPAISGRVSEYPIHFSFSPTESGVRKYTISIPPQSGEVTAKNNAKSVLVKVLKNKMKVVVVAGGPSADVAAVMQALRSDPNIEPFLAVQQPNGLFANRPLSETAPISSADCLILIALPTGTTSGSTLQTISNAVSARQLPVMFTAGRTLDFRKLAQLTSILPFQTVSDKIDEQLAFPNVSPEQANHILVRVSDNALFDWSKLPPIYTSLGSFAAKPEAVVLATTRIQGFPINNPLLVARSAAGEKSFGVLGYGISRWRLLAGASHETETFFDPWLSNIVRWLTTRDESQHVRVAPAEEIFAQGEPIEFFGQVYDASYRPVDDAELRVEISASSSKQRFEAILHPLENGRYEGQVEALPEGEYSFAAAATSGETQLGKSEGRFSVGEQSIEYLDTKMNKPLLEQIAASSGGDFASSGKFDELMRKIGDKPFMKPAKITTTSEFELWNLPSLLSVIVALLGTEWFIRKRSGML